MVTRQGNTMEDHSIDMKEMKGIITSIYQTQNDVSRKKELRKLGITSDINQDNIDNEIQKENLHRYSHTSMDLERKLKKFYWNFVLVFEERLQVNLDFLYSFPGTERFSNKKREVFLKWAQEKDALRDTLAEASYDIFSHYEYQFSTCNTNEELEDLGYVAARRIHNFLKMDNDEINLSDLVTYIVKGVVFGESPSRMNEDAKNFFSKPGICIEENNSLTYYKQECRINNKERLSYRLLFRWEDKSEIKSRYKLITQVRDTYQYVFIKMNKENIIRILRKYFTIKLDMTKKSIEPFTTHKSIKTGSQKEENIIIILKEIESELINKETVVAEGACEEKHVWFEILQLKAEEYLSMQEMVLCDNMQDICYSRSIGEMSTSTYRKSQNDLIGEHINCIEFANSITKFCQNDKVSAADIEDILYKVRQAMHPQEVENKTRDQFPYNYNSSKEILHPEHLEKMSVDNLELFKMRIEQVINHIINHNTDDKRISSLQSAHTEIRKVLRSKEMQNWESDLKEINDLAVSSLINKLKRELQKIQELIDSDYAEGFIGDARLLEEAETKTKRVITQYIKSKLKSDETQEESKIGVERKEEILMSDQVADSSSFDLEKKLKQFSWSFVRSFEKQLMPHTKNPEANVGVDENKNGLRNTLIEATYDIFSHYEYQFSLMNPSIVNELGFVAACRSYNFINSNHENENLTTSYIIKSVVSEESMITPRRTVYPFMKFFSCPSIRIVDGKVTTDYERKEYLQEIRHADSDSSRDVLHLHPSSRLIFPHEDKAIIEATYSMTTKIVNEDYEYKYIKKDKEKQLQILHKFMFIMSKLREPDDIEVEDEDSQVVLEEIELELEQLKIETSVLIAQTLIKRKSNSYERLVAKSEEYLSIQDDSLLRKMLFLIYPANEADDIGEDRQVKITFVKEHIKEIEFAGLITRFCQNNRINLDYIEFLLDQVAEARDRLVKKRELFYYTLSKKTEIRFESPTTALQKECADTSKEFITTVKAIKEMVINSEQFKSTHDTITNILKAEPSIIKFLNDVSSTKLSQQLDEDLSKQLHDFKDQVELLILHSLNDKETDILKRARIEIRKILRSSEAQYRKTKLEHLNNSAVSILVKEYEEELRKLVELIDLYLKYADGNTELVRMLEQAEAKAIQVVTQYIESEVNKTKNENSSGQNGEILSSMELERKLKGFCWNFVRFVEAGVRYNLNISKCHPYTFNEKLALYNYFDQNKESIRCTLVEASYDIFSHYECQFSNVNTDDEIEDLGIETASKCHNYLKENEVNVESTTLYSYIVQGAIFGKSSSKNIENFFSSPGICVNEHGSMTYYEKGERCCSYRLLFPWENQATIRCTYKVVYPIKDVYKYICIEKSRQDQLKIINDFMAIISDVTKPLREYPTFPDKSAISPSEKTEESEILLREIKLELEQSELRKPITSNLNKKAEEYLLVRDELFYAELGSIQNESSISTNKAIYLKNFLIGYLNDIDLTDLVETYSRNDAVTSDAKEILLNKIEDIIGQLKISRETPKDQIENSSEGETNRCILENADGPNTILKILNAEKSVKKYLKQISLNRLDEQLDENKHLLKTLEDLLKQVDFLIIHNTNSNKIDLLKNARTKIKDVLRSREARNREKNLEGLNDSTTIKFVQEAEKNLHTPQISLNAIKNDSSSTEKTVEGKLHKIKENRKRETSMNLRRKLKKFCWAFVQSFETTSLGFELKDMTLRFRKNNLRNILIEAAFNIFCHYECQFSKIPTNDVDIIETLGIGAALNSIDFLLDNDIKHDIADLMSHIIQGVVYEKSKPPVGTSKYVALNFLSNPGIRIIENNIATYYIWKDEHATEEKFTLTEAIKKDFDYRLLFPWEDETVIKSTYQRVDQPEDAYEYQYISKDIKEQLKMLHKHMFIVCKIRKHTTERQAEEDSQIILLEIELELEHIEINSAVMFRDLSKETYDRLSTKAEEYLSTQDELLRKNLVVIGKKKDEINKIKAKKIKKTLVEEHIQDMELVELIKRFSQNDIESLFSKVAEALARLGEKRKLLDSEHI